MNIKQLGKTNGNCIIGVYLENIAVEKMAAAKPGQYDLVLMDIQMPMMNGYEATKRIRAMESTYCRQVPIIAMTANAFEEDKALALQAGMNDYIAKPIQIDKMLKVISKVLECNY